MSILHITNRLFPHFVKDRKFKNKLWVNGIHVISQGKNYPIDGLYTDVFRKIESPIGIGANYSSYKISETEIEEKSKWFPWFYQ